jgi:hypothetical protein
MNRYSVILVSMLSLTACQNCRTLPPPTGVQIYVFAGQSNNVGFAPWTSDTGDSNILMYKNGQWDKAVEPTSPFPHATYGNSVAFGEALRRHNPSAQIGIVNCAVGSTIIDEWARIGPAPYFDAFLSTNYPQGLLQNCFDQIESARGSMPGSQVAGWLFAQGESDANVCGANSPWAVGFKNMVNLIRQRYDVPIIYAQLGSFTPENVCPVGDTDAFRREQGSVSIPRVSMVTTIDLTTVDGVHFDTNSQRMLGQRYAASMIGNAPGRECSEPWWSRLVPKI